MDIDIDKLLRSIEIEIIEIIFKKRLKKKFKRDEIEKLYLAII